MAKAGRLFFRKKRGTSATFHVDEDFRAGYRKRQKRESMGLGRAIWTGMVLSFSLACAFVALHYIPAFLSPSQVIRVSDLDEEAIRKRPDGLMAVLAPYWDSLQSRRSYIWAGESLEVQYRLEGASTLDLQIERCARQVVIEVFACEVVSRETVRVTGKTGIHRLHFTEPGFYHFKENASQDSRVIWRRV